MISLLEVINNNKSYNDFLQYDNEIISESLQEPHLQQLAKELAKKKNKEWFAFSKVFGRLALPWEKITTKDFNKYSAGDKQGIKRVRAILTNTDRYEPGIALLVDSDDKIQYMIYTYGMYSFKNGATEIESKWNSETREYTKKEVPAKASNFTVKQKEASEYCENYDFYVLDTAKFSKEISALIHARRKAKDGVIDSHDEYQLDKIARENRERYNKILAKRKAERLAENDDTVKNVNMIIMQSMQISQQFYNDPETYADITYDVSNLLKLIYDQERTSAWNSGKNRFNKYGKNGLLITLDNYLKVHKDVKKGTNYQHQIDDYKKYKDQLNALIKEAKDLIDKIQAKM